MAFQGVVKLLGAASLVLTFRNMHCCLVTRAITSKIYPSCATRLVIHHRML